MQEAKLEADTLEQEGNAELAGRLRGVVEGLRTLQPEVVARSEGLKPPT
jgi:hypothetical protein